MDFMLNRLFCPSGKTEPENWQETGTSGKTELSGKMKISGDFHVPDYFKNLAFYDVDCCFLQYRVLLLIISGIAFYNNHPAHPILIVIVPNFAAI